MAREWGTCGGYINRALPRKYRISASALSAQALAKRECLSISEASYARRPIVFIRAWQIDLLAGSSAHWRASLAGGNLANLRGAR